MFFLRSEHLIRAPICIKFNTKNFKNKCLKITKTQKTENYEMTNRITDTSQRKTAKIVGALILIAYSVIISLLFEPLIIVMLLELISGAAVVGMAVLMFPILKPHNKNLSLGYVVFKIIEGVVMIVAGILLFTLIIKMETHDLIYGIHDYIFGIAFLMLSYLLYQSKLVPRFISVWGLIASILFLAANLLGMIVLIPAMSSISLLPVILNELFLAIWLIVKGFNEDTIVSGA